MAIGPESPRPEAPPRDAAALLRDADAACVVAKEKGGDRIHDYQPGDSAVAEESAEAADDGAATAPCTSQLMWTIRATGHLLAIVLLMSLRTAPTSMEVSGRAKKPEVSAILEALVSSSPNT